MQEETKRLENSIEVPDLLGSFYMPQELSGNGSYFSSKFDAEYCGSGSDHDVPHHRH